MILLLTRGNSSMCVPLRLPTSPAEEGEAFVQLDTISTDLQSTRIVRVEAPIWNLGNYIKSTDINGDGYAKLKKLAEQLDSMTEKEQWIFSGALDAESIDGLDDILRIAGSLEDYELIEEVTSERKLGGWLVENDMLDTHFPQAVRPYLDYAAIGAEYYSNHGGTYTVNGYVKRKEGGQTMQENVDEVFILHLSSHNRTRCFDLSLPASEDMIATAKCRLEIEDFCEAEILGLDCSIPYMVDALPQECISVEDANELAVAVSEMQHTDGEVLTFLAALEVEQPETFPTALEIAIDLDDYERVPSSPNEYGFIVLSKMIGDTDIMHSIDGYMDFERFGEDCMYEDGVRDTQFGSVRRLSDPFPEPRQDQTML